MTELINGRTTEEIITGLKCEVPCHKCAYRDHNFMKDNSCSYYVEQDIIALIEHLEAKLDAAYRDIPHDCGTCKYWQDPPKIYESKDGGLTVEYCDQDCSGGFPGWVWRGVVKPPEEENV